MSPLVAAAFGAGLLAPVNPCGFALLPAYLSTFLQPTAVGAAAPLAQRLRAALRTGAAITTGFVLAVTAVGAGLAAGLRSVIDLMPWLAVIVGVVLMVAGVVMLLGRHIPVRLPGVRVTAAPGKSLWRLVGFGAGYALASASCTLAILLAVVTQAVTAETVAGVITVFAANATGSALVLLALAVAAALTHTALSAALGGIARYLPRISGALLAASGGYLIAYWLPHLDGSTPTQTSGLDHASASATAWIGANQTTVAVTTLSVIAAAVVISVITGHRHRSDAQATDCCTADGDGAAPPAPPRPTSDPGPDASRTAVSRHRPG